MQNLFLLMCIMFLIKVYTVNFIKTWSIKSLVFSLLCEEMNNRHSNYFFYWGALVVFWGNVIYRIFELHNELHRFWPFCKTVWLEVATLAVLLINIFEEINVWDLSLPRYDVDVFFIEKKTNAMLIKFCPREKQF